MKSVVIESLDHEGRGIAHAEGKVIFIEGALTGERVTYSSYRKKNNYEQAQVGQILKQSFMRVTPKCANFGVCGGCSMQHLEPRAQVAVKQRVLEDNLQRIGKVTAETILPPIYGMPWGYRQRARLSVRHVLKKGKTLVGFREKNGKYVADMQALRNPAAQNCQPVAVAGRIERELHHPRCAAADRGGLRRQRGCAGAAHPAPALAV